ncbi:MAG: phosphoenolpyruvate carboxykinase (GTP) [Parachlamydiales bacterium]|nr:phosphoenolpyruvate carboxykinase (GTP) [Parachlamydiales bacterium]
MDFNIPLDEWTANKNLKKFIKDKIDLCKPKNVYLCSGTKEEYDELMNQMVIDGKAIKLNDQKRPNSYFFKSDPEDVARVEERTFICSEKEIDAGPTNNWHNPNEMKIKLLNLFDGSMQGRTMYVIPFSMGPIGSDKSHIGIEITDSAYVVCNMHIMTRMGKKVIDHLKDEDFIECMHSVGKPLQENEKDTLWPCDPENRYIVHFPEEKSIWSYGSGYGGNALLGKKCFALRIASTMAKKDGWLAEHMLILGITNPEGEKKYFVAAFPSACGKTNMAMLNPSLPGWKIECIGDDIAWMKISEDGRLWAINPEAGFFGVAPGTSYDTNYNAMKSLEKNSIFTNVALTQDNDVWWEGMTKNEPENMINWLGKKHSKEEKAAHPNARFTSPAHQCPIIDKDFENPKGVPISAIIFGGRRDDVVPLVYEAFDWQHGTFLGASVSSQMTAAAKGNIGKLRHDPFAMLPFCGYNMADYFDHWLGFDKKMTSKNLPKIFYVNWFLKDENQKGFIWPGFSDNIRVLKWMFERVDNKVGFKKTAIGNIPNIEDLNVDGLNLSKNTLEKLLEIDLDKWEKEVLELKNYFSIFKDKLPEGIIDQLNKLNERVLKEKSKRCEPSYKE